MCSNFFFAKAKHFYFFKKFRNKTKTFWCVPTFFSKSKTLLHNPKKFRSERERFGSFGESEGENKRGGGMEGLQPMCEGCVGSSNVNQRFLKIVCFRFPTNVPKKNRIYSFLKQNSLSNQNVLFQILIFLDYIVMFCFC